MIPACDVVHFSMHLLSRDAGFATDCIVRERLSKSKADLLLRHILSVTDFPVRTVARQYAKHALMHLLIRFPNRHKPACIYGHVSANPCIKGRCVMLLAIPWRPLLYPQISRALRSDRSKES
jgi:hypothetical protein